MKSTVLLVRWQRSTPECVHERGVKNTPMESLRRTGVAPARTSSATTFRFSTPSPPFRLFLFCFVFQNAGSDALQTYDVVAAVPCCQRSFELLSKDSDVDIISLPSGNRLPFTLNKKLVECLPPHPLTQCKRKNITAGEEDTHRIRTRAHFDAIKDLVFFS